MNLLIQIPNWKSIIDNKSVSSNDSHTNKDFDQLALVSKQLDKSRKHNSIFNLYSNVEENYLTFINNGYTELNDNSHTLPNVIDNYSIKVHSNLEENNIASDKCPNTYSNLENSIVFIYTALGISKYGQ